MKSTPQRTLLALALALAAPAAWANRPLTTDTADVIAEGTNQLEIYVGQASASGLPTERGWTAQLSHGFGFHTQAGLAFSRARVAGETSSGLLVGGKTWLIELGDANPGLSVGYGVTAAKTPGESWEHEGSYVTLIGTQPFGDALLVHANLGWARSAAAKQNSTAWAVGLEYKAAEAVNLVAEAFGDDRGKPTWSVGALWQIAPTFSLNTSYGQTRETPRVRLWTLGFQIDF